MEWLETLSELNVKSLPPVFTDAPDHARTDGALPHRVRRSEATAARHAFINARRQTAANRILEHLPAPGTVLHLALDGEFDLCHLIPRIVELGEPPVTSLELATLGFNDATIDTLCGLSDAGKVQQIRLLASHYFRSVDTDLWGRAYKAMASRGHSLFIARTHAKLQLFRFANGRTITLMSSANLRSCKNAEAAVVFADPDTLHFWQSVIDELIQEAQACASRQSKH